MAENKYSVRIRQAYAGLNVLKPAIQKLAKDGKTNTDQYRALVKQLQEAQAKYDKLKADEKKFLDEEKASKTKAKAAPKQGDLDVANATGNTAEANRIAREMQAAGATPLGLDGKPLKGFEPEVDETLKTGLKDSDKDGIPDNVDAEPNTPAKPLKPTGKDGKDSKGGDTLPPAGDGLDNKTLWVSYLRSTFASLEDKTQKAQIDKLLEDAKAFKYDEKTFMEILKGTIWWQTTLPSMRSFFLETSDPRNASTFTEKVQNKMSTIAAKLDTLGISAMSTDPATGKLIDNSEFIKGLAMQTIQNNWDDAQLEDFIATKSNVMFTGGGTLGSTLEKVKNQAYMYGIKIDSALEKEINFSLLDPNDGRDANYWLYSMKQQAMDSPTYKPFAESLKAGRSLYEVTNNYRQQMANLLEVDSTAITWDDLMGKVVDNTTGNARTFADFTKQVKQDKLWQYTKNAKETYSNMALDLARTFGFSG
jgi:hypothetical protein